ncbi:MAG: hypothetical protein HYX32_01095 [Actinobacteria bacterium]|nr:hypothetical protein [Actinomycetota bacterium]
MSASASIEIDAHSDEVRAMPAERRSFRNVLSRSKSQDQEPIARAKRKFKRRAIAGGVLSLFAVLLWSAQALAQEVAPPDNATLDKNLVQIAQSTNLLWIVIGAVLVIFMQAGFAMVETGFCRGKHAAHVVATNFAIFGLGFLGFLFLGYQFAFGGFSFAVTGSPQLAFGYNAAIGKSLIGSGSWTFLWWGGTDLWTVDGANLLKSGAILGFFLYMTAFMDTTATIPTGSMAERCRSPHRQVHQGRQAARPARPQHPDGVPRHVHPAGRLVRVQRRLDVQRERRSVRHRRRQHRHRRCHRRGDLHVLGVDAHRQARPRNDGQRHARRARRHHRIRGVRRPVGGRGDRADRGRRSRRGGVLHRAPAQDRRPGRRHRRTRRVRHLGRARRRHLRQRHIWRGCVRPRIGMEPHVQQPAPRRKGSRRDRHPLRRRCRPAHEPDRRSRGHLHRHLRCRLRVLQDPGLGHQGRHPV